MTHTHQRRLRGSRYLMRIAGQLRAKRLLTSGRNQFKIEHPEVAEFHAICKMLADNISVAASNYRRRRK